MYKRQDQVLSRFGEGDWLVLQNEISRLPYIVDQAHRRGMKIVLNPSPMDEKIFDQPLNQVDYFLLNEVEAGQILKRKCGSGTDMDELASALSEQFPAAVIVLTIGSEGAIYSGPGKRFRQPVYKVKAVDTTAAGDTFTGYFIAGILKGLPEEKAMDMAAKAAAIAVTRPGAAPSIPKMQEVEMFCGESETA